MGVADNSVYTGPLSERLRCCICGEDTTDADDYVIIRLTAATETTQYLGAHAKHLNAVLAKGFSVEVHLM